MKRVFYSDALADDIVERIANGETLRAICRDSHMPTWSAVYRWISENEGFATAMNHARELGAEAIAEEALAIADTPEIGEETEDDGERLKVRRGDMLGHRKLQVDTRLKLLAKWHPKKYGDRSAVELTGADGGPVQIDETKRAARVAALVSLAQKRKAASEKGGDSDDVSDLV